LATSGSHIAAARGTASVVFPLPGGPDTTTNVGLGTHASCSTATVRGVELRPATVEAYLRLAYGRMLAVADRLGEPLVNQRPLGPDTNAVGALIAHCCGLTEYWLGHVALGDPSDRDRDAEFAATPSLAELHAVVEATIERSLDLVARLEAGEGTDDGGRTGHPTRDTSDGGIVLHVLEELFQHLGHMELAADALLG
jgi:uncharacterized damage-inducible protein DinB